MKTLKLITPIAAALMLAGCCTTGRSTRWEYKVVGGDVLGTLERNINNAASEGWQVVSASKYGAEGNAAFVVMRRSKKPE